MKQGGLGSRLIVAGWGIPILIGFTWLGGWWTALLVAGIVAFGQIEYYRLMEALGRKPLVILGLSGGLSIVLLWQVGGAQDLGWTLGLIFVGIALAGLLGKHSHQDVITTFSGVIYPALLGGAFLIVRHHEGAVPESGRWLALGVWGSIWICDTAAYFGGRAFGKTPLMPAVSPKKTVEGFAAGAFGTLLFTLAWWYFGLISLDLAFALFAASALIGQLGDLVESLLKREVGVKDSGRFLPGHGGILDRFDSFFAAAPVLAAYLFLRGLL